MWRLWSPVTEYEGALLSRLVGFQDHFELDHRRVSVADGKPKAFLRNQEVDEFDQQIIYLRVVDDAPVVCIRSKHKVGLAKAEQARQALAGVALADQAVLSIVCGPYACVCPVQAAPGMARFVLHLRAFLLSRSRLSLRPALSSRTLSPCEVDY